MSCDMWFGTKDYAQFIRTPQTGADVSPQAWGSSGTLLNGSGYVFNSFNSHKEYSFSWGATAAREAAQTMKSYFDGSFGRGKLHFVDPLTYSTNVLPARWADPSITADFEGPQLVPGVDPYTVPTSNFQWLRLPVRTAVFDLDTVQPVANTVFLPEAENLFTNPNLVGDGTWAEVRRNRYVASGIGFGSGSSIVIGAYSGGYMEVTPGEVVSFAKFGEPEGNRFQYGFTDGVPSSSTPLVGRVNRSNTTTEETGVVVPDGVTHLAMYFGNNTPDARGFATSETVNPLGNLFDGSTTPESAVGVVQPEDFRWRWLGEPNASESVMEIEQVRGLIGVRGVAGVSSWEGKPAARLIPTDDTGNGAYFQLAGAKPSEGTFTATVNLKAPLTNIGSPTNGRRVYLAAPLQYGTQAPNEAGSFESRVHYSGTGSLVAHNGNRLGGGDVWWTNIGLFAGDYTGPWFSGDTEIPGKVTRWTGAPNNSTSQIGVLQPVSTPNVNEENSVFVPIPDGMQLNVGAFYSGSPEAGVYVVNATQGGSPGMNITRLQPLTPSDTNILPNVFTKAPGDIGVYIIFGKLEIVDAILNVTAIHARLSPIGVNPQGENYWLGGQGNEGVRFVQPPTYINHTGVNGGQVEFAATFKESIH